MQRGHMKTVAWTILVMLAVASLASFAQGFGSPDSSFGASETERSFETPGAEASGSGSSYFIHDQLTKFLLVLGFTGAGLAILLTRRFRLRRWLLIASVVVLGFTIGGMLCPISAVQNVILKASIGYLLLFLVPTVTAVLAGRLFCGYVCPFGALQELLHVKRLRRVLPARWMRGLRFVPYAILAYLVVRVFVTGVLAWDGTTPFKAFFTFGGTALTLGISGFFALLSVFLFRPFCRLFCPLGAWLSLVSRVSPFRVRVGPNCVSCGTCDGACSACAMQGGSVRSADCLLCGECIAACPVDALSWRRKGASKSAEPSETPRD